MIALLCAACLILSCQSMMPGPPTNVRADVLTALTGSYSNAAQYQATDAALKVLPKIGDIRPWVDQKHAVFKRVENSTLPGAVIALEWRNTDANGDVSRQRLWAFRQADKDVFMDFYSLKNPVDFSDDDLLANLGPDDLISYGAKCALPLQIKGGVYHFSIPETCRITSRSGRDMVLSADIILADTLRYREAGRLVGGDPIFQVPGAGLYYEFRSEP